MDTPKTPLAQDTIGYTKQILNSFSEHPINEHQMLRLKYVNELAKDLSIVINNACPNSREKSLALTKVEEAVMWVRESILRNE